MTKKDYVIYSLIECYFNIEDFEKPVLISILKKLNMNDLENLDLYLNRRNDFKI